MGIKELAACVISVSGKIHSSLGIGLFKEIYEDCLIHELTKKNIKAEKHKYISIEHDGVKFENAFMVDVFVDDKLVVGIKPLDMHPDLFHSYLENYARYCGSTIAVALDFNVHDFRTGVKLVEKKSSKPLAPPMMYSGYYYGKRK